MGGVVGPGFNKDPNLTAFFSVGLKKKSEMERSWPILIVRSGIFRAKNQSIIRANEPKWKEVDFSHSSKVQFQLSCRRHVLKIW